jgi:methyl-accepting chemotaxis protein/methyl-accepting chemotaxis protein-1 (serine sensor receptor)
MSGRKWTLGKKVTLSQGLITLFLALTGAAALYSITSLSGLLDSFVQSEVRRLEVAGAVDSALNKLTSDQGELLLSALTGKLAEVNRLQSAIERSGESLERDILTLEALSAAPGERRGVEELKKGVAEWKRQFARLNQNYRDQRYDEATRMQGEVFRPLFDRMAGETRRIVEQQKKDIEASWRSSKTIAVMVRTVAFGLLALGLAVALAGFFGVSKTNRDLRAIAGEIAEGARHVASAAQQVSAASQALAQGSSEQAASLEETSASAEEINSMTQKNAENARTAASETEKADQLLKETDRKLGEMIGSMREINTSSEKISKIIRVIDEIAFQTNILALNAAVEAARAGEAGMGFAVVADEVRNLAQRCAQAAKDTSELIEESIVRSQEGKVKLDDVANWISKVVDNAARIRVLSNEVHLGSQEQARGIEQIARAVTQMQQLTQNTAASAEQSASAGEEMSGQASNLNEAVSRLHDLVGVEETRSRGGRPAGSPPARGAGHARGAPKAVKPQAGRTVPAAARPAARSEFPLDDDFRDF